MNLENLTLRVTLEDTQTADIPVRMEKALPVRNLEHFEQQITEKILYGIYLELMKKMSDLDWIRK